MKEMTLAEQYEHIAKIIRLIEKFTKKTFYKIEEIEKLEMSFDKDFANF